MDLLNVDMARVIHFTVSPLELIARGTLMFWFLFLIFRLILRRDVGAASITDFLFVVILGDAAQNAMIGQATSVSDGMVLIATLVMWNYAIDSLSFYFPCIERLVSAQKLCLVRDGKLMQRNMRREFITHKELNEKLREAGVENVAHVKRMFMEADGEISVLKYEK